MNTADYIKKIVAPQIQAMNAYHVAPSDNVMKLDSMENSYPLSDEVKQALLSELQNAQVNRYPDSRAEKLRQYFLDELFKSDAVSLHTRDDVDVLFGNGSDELIQLLMQLVAKDAGPIMSPSPSFSMYRVFANIIDKPFQKISLNRDFSIDMERAEQEIRLHQPSLIFIAYPNNPTGNLFDKAHIRKIIDLAPGLVVIDEAYSAFSSQSFNDEFLNFPNVVLLKTLSKEGFAGIRFGYMYGNKAWVEQVNKIRPPYNVNVLSQSVASVYINYQNEFAEQARKICLSREWLMQQFNQIEAISALPSETNFITFAVKNKKADDLFLNLKQHGILIKNLHNEGGHLAEHLRVTIGTQEECEIFLDRLKVII